MITFAFTNPVSFTNTNRVATIEYTLEGEEFLEYVKESDCQIGWNRLDGYYTVSFIFASEDYPEEDLSSVKITLNGVVYNPGDGLPTVPVTVAPVVLTKEEVQQAPRKVKNRMSDELTNGNELVNIYNVQGMLVKENVSKSAITELPAGFYIVDGKKIVVR